MLTFEYSGANFEFKDKSDIYIPLYYLYIFKRLGDYDSDGQIMMCFSDLLTWLEDIGRKNEVLF